MAKELITEWRRIGRSGPTIDGRNIEPEWLEQAAKNYTKEVFSAPIWPGHSRWYRLGTVEALRSAANDNGGVDLFAQIAPNDYYLQANKEGQRLHTSMELQPNFLETDEWYLTGLAATDEPASAATDEMKFSAQGKKDTLFSAFIENEPTAFNKEEVPHWFKSLFTKPENNEDVMSKQLLEEIQAKVVALETKLADKKPVIKPEEPADKTELEVLSATVVKLSEQVNGIADVLASDDKEPGKQAAEDYETLKTQVTELSSQLAAALKEEKGTDAGENGGSDFKSDDFQ